MRIYTTSDLHYDKRDKQTIDVLKRMSYRLLAMGQASDILVINGDLGDSEEEYIECLELFRDFKGVKLITAGNHDIFVHASSTTSSLDRYNRLPEVCASVGFKLLDDGPVILENENAAIVGNMGWYDFSFCKNPKNAGDTNEAMVLHDNETGFKWDLTDEVVVAMMVKKLEDHLDQVKHIPNVTVFLHHWATGELLPGHRFWRPRVADMAYGFWGSQAFGDVISRYKNIKFVFSGHAHIQREVSKDGVTYRSIASLPYLKELVMLLDNELFSILVN